MKQTILLFTCFWLISCSGGYSEKVIINEQSEVFYKPDATEADAQKLGAYLLRKGYFDTEIEKSVLLSKKDSVYSVRLITDRDSMMKYMDDLGPMMWFWQQDISSSVFNNDPVRLILAGADQKDFHTFPEIKNIAVNERNHVYYPGDVKDDEAERLSRYFATNQQISEIEKIFLTRHGNSLFIRIPATEFIRLNVPESTVVLASHKEKISREVFNNQPVSIIIMNNDYEAIDDIPDLTDEQRKMITESETRE